MKRIETERLVIRKIDLCDADMAHELFCDEDAMRWVGIFPPLNSIEKTKERLREWHADEEEERFSILKKDTKEFLGYVAINPDSEEEREDTKELGFALRKKVRGQGYMNEALRAVLNELKQEGITYVWACCFKGNASSEKLIRNLGFQLMQEGTYEVENDRTYESLEFRIEL